MNCEEIARHRAAVAAECGVDLTPESVGLIDMSRYLTEALMAHTFRIAGLPAGSAVAGVLGHWEEAGAAPEDARMILVSVRTTLEIRGALIPAGMDGTLTSEVQDG